MAHDASMPQETLRIIDLRSDTVTKPTPAMREAMARAEVGDDVFGDDPTVKKLESRTAGVLGKEAALFVPSGTMANQLAIRGQTEPGDEVLVEANAHLYYYESGAPAVLSGVMCRCLNGQRGIFSGGDVEAALRPADQHFPRTRLVCLENTHNRGGGKIWPLERIREVSATARKHGLQLHLDGARLWNASVATGIPERDYAAHFDTVSVCYSKGWERRSVPPWWGRRYSSNGSGGSGRCSAAGCGRRESLPPVRCLPSKSTAPGWPMTMPMRKLWLPGWLD